MKLSVGADPEVFVRKHGEYISAHIFECGTKDKPMEVPHGTVQVDGTALEFNVRPSFNPSQFVSNIKHIWKDLTRIVHAKDREFELVNTPVVFFGKKNLRSFPEHARELGCTPDYNAYTGMENARPNSDLPIRTGAGHVHLGWCKDIVDVFEPGHYQLCRTLTKEMDFLLGIPSLVWDDNTLRRKLYGKAGAFRPKPYGVEYRVLSNAWVTNPKLMVKVFKGATQAWKNLQEDKLLSVKYGDIAQDCVNNGKLAFYQKEYPELVKEVC